MTPDTRTPDTKKLDTKKLDTLFGHLKPRYIVYASETDLPPVRKVSYDYILAGNGLFKRAANDHLEACICVQDFRIAVLLSMSEYIHPTSRFPGHLLGAVYEDAERFARLNQERMYFLHIDPEEENRGPTRAWVSMPSQVGQGQKVDYRPSHFAQTVICDLHSHHTMKPFFSGTDNADEQGFGFYAVVGNMLERPELRLRLGVFGDFMELPADTLFEGELGLFADAYMRPSELRFDRAAEWYPGGDGSEGGADWFSSLDVPDDLWGKVNDLCLAENETPETLMARLIGTAWEKEYFTPEEERNEPV